MDLIQLKTWLTRTLEQTSAFQAICQPLMDKLPISFIRLTRIYKEGKLALLSTRPDAVEWYFREKKYEFGVHEQDYATYQSGFVLTDSWPETSDKIDHFLKPMRDDFNIGSELALYYQQPNYIDIFEVGLGQEQTNANILLMQHFNLIDKFCQNQLLPSSLLKKHCAEQQIDLQLFHSEQPKKDFHNYFNQLANITSRELECLFWFKQGKSIPEIAQILELSHRTVEKYVLQIKSKWQIYNSFQLGYLIGQCKEHFDLIFSELNE